jgi:hypothetical protein
MDDSFWSPFLRGIVTALVFALLPLFFPARIAHDADAEAPLTDEERRVYRRWEVGISWSFLPLVALCCFALYLAFTGAAGLFHKATPETRFLVRTDSDMWVIPAVFLAFILTPFPMEWFFRLVLRDRYRRFERYFRDVNERSDINWNRALKWLAALAIAGSSVFSLANVTYFARFDESAVEIGRPLEFRTKFYLYSQVKSIEHRETDRAPSGDIIQCPHYVILFDDGTSWSTVSSFRGNRTKPDLDGQIAQLVARESGRSIEERP